MSYYELFQNNESSLNSAYNSASLDVETSSLPYCDEGDLFDNSSGSNNANSANNSNTTIESSTINNLWDFLGLSNLKKKDKSCLFDCSINGTECLKNCSPKNYNKCKYSCFNEGLKCTKECVVPKQQCQPTPTGQTTISNPSNNSNNHDSNSNHSNSNHSNNSNHLNNSNNHDSNSNNHQSNNSNHSNNSNNHHSNNSYNPPQGNKYFFSNYAPVDSSLWPNENQPGWNINKIENSNSSNNNIEVLLHDYHPVKNGDPELLF